MSLFSASGGLLYHLKALRHRDGLWAPYRTCLAGWIGERLANSPEVVLVGPSAGHCMPLEVFARVPEVLALEPDPVARWLLGRRLRSASLRFETRDLLVTPLLSGAPGLDELLAERPSASVVFCNVLGQVGFGLTDREQARFQREFRRRIVARLAGRLWLSFHDRWSFDAHAPASSPVEMGFPRQPSDDELGRAWFGAEGPAVTVFDHATASLFPAELPHHYFAWQVTPRARHIIEGVSNPR